MIVSTHRYMKTTPRGKIHAMDYDCRTMCGRVATWIGGYRAYNPQTVQFYSSVDMPSGDICRTCFAALAAGR